MQLVFHSSCCFPQQSIYFSAAHLFLSRPSLRKNTVVFLYHFLGQRICKQQDQAYNQVADGRSQSRHGIDIFGNGFRLYNDLTRFGGLVADRTQNPAAEAACQRLADLTSKGVYRVNSAVVAASGLYLLVINYIGDKRPD